MDVRCIDWIGEGGLLLLEPQLTFLHTAIHVVDGDFLACGNFSDGKDIDGIVLEVHGVFGVGLLGVVINGSEAQGNCALPFFSPEKVIVV